MTAQKATRILFDLVKASHIKYSTLHAAETRGSQFSVDTIERICAGLGITGIFILNEVTPAGLMKKWKKKN